MPRFSDIPQISMAGYYCTYPWRDLKHVLANWGDINHRVVLDPDYQRGNVWTKRQKQEYVEYILRGGISGKDIYWNCPGWMSDFRGPMELVDGKQRVTTVLEFQENKFKVFGHYFKEYEDKLDLVRHTFTFHVNSIVNRADVIRWYLDLNSGTPHTRKDIKKAEDLLRSISQEP